MLMPVFSCSRRECGNCNRESEKVELLSTQKPCCILYSLFNLWICLVGEVLVFISFLCDLPACFLSLKLAWVNVWLCPLSPRIPLCNLINPFISLAPVYPMFPTNWEWISKKKKEEHVHNHRHLFTCLRKTTRFLRHRKKILAKKKNRISPYCNFVSPYQFPELKAASFSVQMKGKNAGGCFPLRTGD